MSKQIVFPRNIFIVYQITIIHILYILYLLYIFEILRDRGTTVAAAAAGRRRAVGEPCGEFIAPRPRPLGPRPLGHSALREPFL